jgi:hypothetical protein
MVSPLFNSKEMVSSRTGLFAHMILRSTWPSIELAISLSPPLAIGATRALAPSAGPALAVHVDLTCGLEPPTLLFEISPLSTYTLDRARPQAAQHLVKSKETQRCGAR